MTEQGIASDRSGWMEPLPTPAALHRWPCSRPPNAGSRRGKRQVRRIVLLSAERGGEISVCFGTTLLGLYLRSEEHTSELQSRRDLVCRLLLEKKKKGDC